MADNSSCSSCHTALLPGAPFCHTCGVAAAGTTPPAVSPAVPAGGPPSDRLQVVLDDPPAVAPTPAPVAPASGGSTPAGPPPVMPAAAAGPAAAAFVAPPDKGLSSVAKGFLVAGAVAVAAGVGFLVYRATSEPDTVNASSSSPNDESGNGSTDSGGSGGGSGSTDSGGGESAAPSGDGSDDAFCNEVDEIAAESAAAASEFAEIPEDDTLGGLIFLIQALGDIQVYVDRMVEVAPDEIRSDMEVVAESIQPVTSTDPFEIAFALIEAYSHLNSFERVDAYTAEHCGVSLFGSQPTG